MTGDRTVVSMEPTSVAVHVAEVRVHIAIETEDARVDIGRSGSDAGALMHILDAKGDLEAVIEFADADVDLLTVGLSRLVEDGGPRS